MAIRGNGGISLDIVRTELGYCEREVRSASFKSSFFCLIFSFNCSPSRFAAMIFSCQSDIMME